MEDFKYFCNEWACPFRENKIHKNTVLCDRVWSSCPLHCKL